MTVAPGLASLCFTAIVWWGGQHHPVCGSSGLHELETRLLSNQHLVLHPGCWDGMEAFSLPEEWEDLTLSRPRALRRARAAFGRAEAPPLGFGMQRSFGVQELRS